MKTTHLLTAPPLTGGKFAMVVNTETSEVSAQNPLPFLTSSGNGEGHETVRHILLGSPGAVRQTIHLLHSLHYSETVLWSPIMTVEDELIITPAQGEAMSLLRKQV